MPEFRGRKGCWLGLCAALAVGCASGPRAAPPPKPQSGLALVRDGQGRGPDLAVLAQPGAPLLQLSLFIDAGSRDADPPQAATLAAWLVAQAAGSSARAQVLPDGIEVSLPCRPAELSVCLARLQGALALREPEPRRLAAAQERLAAARRAADAAEPTREADRLALAALFGEERAAGFFPLGRAQDDGRAGSGQVREFLAQHMGPERALLVVAGDIAFEAVYDAAGDAFARAPAARAVRAQAREPANDEGGVAVDVADARALSLALFAPDLPSAHAAALAFKARLEREGEALGLRGRLGGEVLPIRGGALALLRANAKDPAGAVQTAAHELERARREPSGTPSAESGQQGSSPLARRLGMQWIALGASGGTAQLALGIGALVEGGRADRVGQADPDAEQRGKVRAQLQAAFAAGGALARPELHGDVDDRGATVALDNGARLELRAREGDQVALAARFAHGAALDPPGLHGRTALLATLMATACAGLSPDALSARLTELGAVLEPRVDAESFGLMLTAPAGQLQPALSLLIDCALHPGLARGDLNSARLRLLARIGREGGEGELRAAAAELLSPGAPGAVAPWGSPARQSGVSLAAVRELFAVNARGPLLTVAAVGPLQVEPTLAWAAPRLAAAAAGAAPAPKGAPPAADLARPQPEIRKPTLGLALFRTPGGGADAAGARGFAALLRAAIGQVTDVTAVWHAGGAELGVGWAAVGLAGAPEAVEAAVASLPAIVQRLPRESLELAADRAHQADERARAARLGSPVAEADALARRGAIAPETAASDRTRARDQALSLARSRPEWLPLR